MSIGCLWNIVLKNIYHIDFKYSQIFPNLIKMSYVAGNEIVTPFPHQKKVYVIKESRMFLNV